MHAISSGNWKFGAGRGGGLGRLIDYAICIVAEVTRRLDSDFSNFCYVTFSNSLSSLYAHA